MRRFLLDVVAPTRSLTGTPGAWVTADEARVLAALRPYTLGASTLRRRGVRHVDCLFAGASYGATPLLRTLIRRWKYHGVGEYASWCAGLSSRALPPLPTASLCPVPLHWARRWWRGSNQAECLARHIAQVSHMPVVSCLVRRRGTGAQARRSRQMRRHALDGAFVVTGRVPEHVLLVDDVMTTGATLDACALALRNAGVRRVDAVVIALG